jgi:hypothetical protein
MLSGLGDYGRYKKNFKNCVDQELGKPLETERRFYQRLRDTPKSRNMKTTKKEASKAYN